MLNTFQQQDHDALVSRTADEAARQEFAKSLKQFIQQDILPGVGVAYGARAAPRFEQATGHPPEGRRDIRKAMIVDRYFRHYAALNRISQELLWDSVIDSIERDEEALLAALKECSSRNAGELRLNGAMPVPGYITSLDIHCMPGGYAGRNAKGSCELGALYDRGVYLYTMGYTGPTNDDMGRSVCNYIKRNFPDFRPRRILDLGCTVGHSTLPFKEMFPDAELWGVDVAAPQLEYAHARAGALGLDVNFAQMNAEQTEFESGSFDLVVSHILLHETSAKAMPRIFNECHRLLSDEGLMIHADLPPFLKMDDFSQFLLDNETWYNNEPFWGAMRDMDQEKLAEDAGFDPADVRFDTAPMAIMEASAGAQGYGDESVAAVEEREFVAGEFAPGGGWEVLIGRKAAAAAARAAS
ncbi:MAG: SAM-dependent methyltransferase [Halieaceae bacterium]|jgi:SAM-dependent methyltransferase